MKNPPKQYFNNAGGKLAIIITQNHIMKMSEILKISESTEMKIFRETISEIKDSKEINLKDFLIVAINELEMLKAETLIIK